MSLKPNQLRRRAALFAENLFCPDCGVEMILPDDIPRVTEQHERGQMGNLKYFPDNLCTMEHPVTKLEPDKRRASREMLSLLCKKCNGLRGRETELRVGIDELHTRSKHH